MTTTNSLLIASTPGGLSVGSGSFKPSSGQLSAASTTEIIANAYANTAFTLANFGIRVITNAGSPVFKSRVNGANGNQIISVGASATGWFTDSTHSDSVSAGQPYCWENTASSPTVTIASFAAQNTSPLVAWEITGASTIGFPTTAGQEWVFGAAIANLNNESVLQSLARAAGTWKSLALRVNSSVTGTITVKSRKNGADGNQVLSAVNPTSAAVVQDTTHSDSIASGDLINFNYVCTAASGNWTTMSSEFAGTISAHDLGCVNINTGGGQAFSASTTYYQPLSSALSTNTTEVNAQASLPYALTLSKLRTRVRANTSATATLKSRKNTADGNCVISVTSGTTGELEDTTHSDSFAATDLANTVMTTGTLTTFTLDNILVLVNDGSVTPNVTVNATGVSAAGAAGTAAAEIDVPAAKVSGAGAPGTLATTASGTASPTGVAAAGAAGTVSITSGGSVALAGVSAAGVANPVGFNGTGRVTGVSAAMPIPLTSAQRLTPSVSVALVGASAFGAAGSLSEAFPISTYFPALSIMRNAPVPSIGGMANTDVAVIGRLPPSGPEPESLQVEIAGVSAQGRVAGLQIRRNLSVALTGVSSAGSAGLVVAA